MTMDRRVQFLRATLVNDGFSSVETFASHGSPIPAQKQDISDGERMRAGEVQAHITTRFQVRWSAFTTGLTPKDRLSTEGRTYDIFGIKEMDRRRTLEISAAARADK